MSRKNKTLRAFLHQNENPTIEQAWDHAWKGAQKEFHARSMQEMEATIDRLVESYRALRDQCDMNLDDIPESVRQELIAADELLAELDATK